MQVSQDMAQTSFVLLKAQDDLTNGSPIRQAEKSLYVEASDTELLSPSLRPIAEKNLVKTLDLRLLPMLVLIYILSYIDVSAVHEIWEY